ncbi:MAG TPA: ABATE domain-containing protein, partial [Phytomonospora sp.]
MTGALPLAIELANTTYAVRGVVQDGLRTREDLTAWLTRLAPRLPGAPDAVGPADLAAARALRDAIRGLARSFEDGEAPDPAEVATVNLAARAAPHWTELRAAAP